MGWDPDVAAPPAGPPIAVAQPGPPVFEAAFAPEPVAEPVAPVAEPVFDVVADPFDSPDVTAGGFEVGGFEVVEPEVLDLTPPDALSPEGSPAGPFEPVEFEPVAFEPVVFEPVVLAEPDLGVFDPNEFELPYEPVPNAGEFPDPVVLDAPLDAASTQAFAAATWPEPEVVPPAFDPEAPAPPAATPADPLATAGLGQMLFDGGDEDLPRRIPGASPLGVDGEASSLPQRSPGRHLSHQPAAPPGPTAERDARPRPERVHDLLTRHLRGIRDGRGDDLTTRVPADHADTEASP
jgi:hypothetical protein